MAECPSCENELEFEPWVGDLDSQEICPFCGIQFGYDDACGGDRTARQALYEKWRTVWEQNGKKPIRKK